MSKGLEALERIKPYADSSIDGELDIIEEELKEYEKTKAIRRTTTFDKAIEDTLINACPNVAKKLKALEIIKNMPDKYKDGLVYIFLSLLNARKITTEEYDLLKEVLL